MKTLLLLVLLTPLTLLADKERERELRDSRRTKQICYRVAAVSAGASFVGGSAAAWLFYYIQSKRNE
jgi:hypothetical protein